jgi:glucose/arabinose dehydrogenase
MARGAAHIKMPESTSLPPRIRSPHMARKPEMLSRTHALLLLAGSLCAAHAAADSTPLVMLDPNLEASVFLTGLSQPMGVIFLAQNDMLVLEKASGKVQRVIDGVIQPTPVLDLAVNSNSERGLLSMALDPQFAANHSVYIRWTQSSTGADSTVALETPLIGNRVDRYTWDGSTLTFAQNILNLRSLQTDNVAVPGHPGVVNANAQGNHNGGVIKFGPDGKLYVFMGDQGRRGWLQNLPNGPFLTAPFADDSFGGPAPDNAHLSGVILRLNTDGTAPADNPFFAAGAAMGGEVGANIQKIFSYGHRNGFGMAFDPQTGSLWETENADDAMSELNRVAAGMNGGWVQLAGPLNRFAQFKLIETTLFNSAVQQARFPPTRLAYTSAVAQSRMLVLPGATYHDPEFSWLYEIGPAGTAFVTGDALGPEYNGTLWMGSSRGFNQVGGNGGSVYRFRLTPDRLHVDTSADPRIADHVADNLFRPEKFDGTESESLQIGKGFGTTPDIEQGPDGNLYVVSVTDGVIYRIRRHVAPPPIMAGRPKGGGLGISVVPVH